MATRYIIIFAILVAVAAGCCFPKKFMVYIDQYSATSRNNLDHKSQTKKYAYDSIAKKVSVDYSNGKKYVYDYSKGIFYRQLNSTQCSTYKMRATDLKEICLLGLKSLGHYNLGAGKLPFTVYGSRISSNGVASGHLFSLSKGCLPLIFSSYSNSSRYAYFSASVWTNMQLNFNSSVVFKPPKHCQSPTSSKRHNIKFDFMDEINKAHSQPLNKKTNELIDKIDNYMDQMEKDRQQEELRFEEEMRMRQEERRRQQELEMYEREAESERDDRYKTNFYNDDEDDELDWE